MRKNHKTQEGSVLLEALIAIIIFSIGILGLVATLARSSASVNDTRQRDALMMAAFNGLNRDHLNPYDKKVKDYLPDSAFLDPAQRQNSDPFEFTFGSNTSQIGKNNCRKQDRNNNLSIDAKEVRGQLGNTLIEYGINKQSETGNARYISFCSYRDDGPFR